MTTPDENNSVGEIPSNEGQKSEKGRLNLEQVGRLLTELSVTMTNARSWKDITYMYEEQFGEIRTQEDWRQFPRDEPVRVVFLYDSDGPVLRWAMQDKQLMEEIEAVQEKRYLATLNGDQFDADRYDGQLRELQNRLITHADMASYRPKAESGFRQGYITLKANDELIIHAKGDHILHL